jgi:hypothetical protein
MSDRSSIPSWWQVAAVASGLAVSAGPTHAQESLRRSTVEADHRAVKIRPLSPHDRAVVDRVRTRAAARLEGARCRGLLTDFKDRDGRTLDENLQPLGKSASGYLLGLPFLDGSGLNVCRSPSVTMAATPGLQRVFVCPSGVGILNSRLAQVDVRNASLAEAMVIHEMLHTLGLGENPPTTFEITRRVRERCR